MLHVKTILDKSSIEGIGLFAAQFIPKGATIWSFHEGFDVRVTKEIISRLPNPAQEAFLKYAYLNDETGKYVYCSDDARFFNHSETPNTCDAESPDGDEDGLTIASRDIFLGEEITCDYRTFVGDFTSY